VTDDRRSSERVHSVNLVSLATLGEDGYVELAELGRTLDISEGGIKLEAFEEIPVGTLAKLRIGLRDEIVDVEGRIAHVVGAQRGRVVTGIQFVNMSREQSDTLRRFLADRGGE